jgi:hypothetical protein
MKPSRINLQLGFGGLRRRLGWLTLAAGLVWLPGLVSQAQSPSASGSNAAAATNRPTEAIGGISQPQEAPQYNVKAGYLCLFTGYTTWPTNIFAASNSPIVIGVLGANPFGGVLVETAARQQGARPLQVRHLTEVGEADGCQLVFISRAEEKREAEWLADLRGKPILTVGESDHTLGCGGVLALKIVDGHVGFDVNWSALRHMNLKINSQMLQHALNRNESNETPH